MLERVHSLIGKGARLDIVPAGPGIIYYGVREGEYVKFTVRHA